MLYRIVFVFFLCLFSLKTHAQASRFGWGLVDYANILNSSYKNGGNPSNGIGGFLEFGKLKGVHLEPGIQLGGNFFFGGGFLAHLRALPYLRYYFGDNDEMRVYMLFGLGLAVNLGTMGFGAFPGAQLGLGMRFARFVELGFGYRYAGAIYDDPMIQLHSLTVNLALSFGGAITRGEQVAQRHVPAKHKYTVYTYPKIKKRKRRR